MPTDRGQGKPAADLAVLLSARRFLPLFLTQFLGAFNDNIFKNALVILITYRAATQVGIDGAMLVTLAAGIFILPFFLFSATAGQVADVYEKSRLIRIIKMAEIVIMALGSVAFWLGDITLLLGVLFLMGTQSAFFGPLKYAILPDHLPDNELIGGNGLIEAATFLAILLGTIGGGLLILTDGGVAIISAMIMSFAVLGYLSSRAIPPALPTSQHMVISYNILSATWAILRHSAGRKDIFMAIIGISWFWFVGAVFLAQFPNYTKQVIGGNEQIVALFLTCFAIGIAMGSLLCNRLLKGVISTRYVPYAALMMSLFIGDLYLATRGSAITGPATLGAWEFLQTWAHIRVVADFILIAIAGGVYIVPLYALVQEKSAAGHQARTIASLNVMNSLFMVASALITMVLFAAGLNVPHVFLAVGMANLFAAAYLFRLSVLEAD